MKGVNDMLIETTDLAAIFGAMQAPEMVEDLFPVLLFTSFSPMSGRVGEKVASAGLSRMLATSNAGDIRHALAR